MSTTPDYLTPLQLAVMRWPAMVRPDELGPGRTSLIARTEPAVTVGGVIYTALAPGVSVQHVVAGNNTPLTVPPVTGSLIVVNVATGAGGAPTSMQTLIAAALAAQPTAAALATAAGGAGVASTAAATPISGSASLIVTGAAFDDHTVLVQVLTDPNTFRYQTDGATWSWPVQMTGVPQALLSTAVDTSEPTEGADTGIRATWPTGLTAPSYVAGEQWSWSTKAIPAIVAAIRSASADAKSLISGPDGGGQFTGDILTMDDGVRGWVGDLARQVLANKRGYDPQSDAGRMIDGAALRATKALEAIGQKLRFPEVTEAGPAVAAPSVLLGHDSYGISESYRCGRGRFGRIAG